MTNEQWLVYLWSIYPNGGFMVTWLILLVGFTAFTLFTAVLHFDGYEDETTLEAGKSLADSLNDPTSKMFKLNQLVDKSLEKMLIVYR